MKLMDINEFSKPEEEIARSKRVFGLLYGIITGLTYAIASYAIDGTILSQSHAYLPWTMLISGAILCATACGIFGWLTSYLESSLTGALFWLLAALLLAGITVALPMYIMPFVATQFDPALASLMIYERNVEFLSRFGVTLAWILPIVLIVGVTQVPILEPAVFATSFFGKMKPFLFSIVIISLGSMMIDDVINKQLRSAIVSLDKTIQFVVDNKGNDNVDKVLSREMRARSLTGVLDEVSETRYLFVAGFDKSLGDLDILVKFEDTWAACEVLYSQPLVCKPVPAK